MLAFVAKEKKTALPIRDIGKTIHNWDPKKPQACVMTAEDHAMIAKVRKLPLAPAKLCLEFLFLFCVR